METVDKSIVVNCPHVWGVGWWRQNDHETPPILVLDLVNSTGKPVSITLTNQTVYIRCTRCSERPLHSN